MKAPKLRKITAKQILHDLIIPEDFSVEVIQGYKAFPTVRLRPLSETTYQTAVLVNPKLRIQIYITVELSIRGERTWYGDAQGHTCYQDEEGQWHSFDKIGKGDSFAVNAKDDENPATILLREVTRVEHHRLSIESRGGWLTIPDIFFKVLPDTLEKQRRELLRHHGVTLTNEEGRGYTISMLKQSPWAKPSPKIAQFYLIKSAYVESVEPTTPKVGHGHKKKTTKRSSAA